MHTWSNDVTALFTIAGLISLFTLTVLELILGIDNIIFISIIVDRLPKNQQKSGRTIGLLFALLVRIILLFFVGWLVKLTTPMFAILNYGVTGKSLILFGGGLFLIYKSWLEILQKIKTDQSKKTLKGKSSFNSVIFQIVLIDFVFSFDSVLTAVGLSGVILIMILSVVISMILMMLMAEKIANFINKYSGIKMIALFFLLVIGFMLAIEAVLICYNTSLPHEQHIEFNKNCVYVALAFALAIEYFNIKERRNKKL